MRSFLALALGGGLLAGAAQAQDLPQGDPAAGEALMPQCRTCHGATGIANLIASPNIAGEPADYLAAQMVHFREGVRQNEMMTIVMASMTDQQIADLAAWYASHVPTVTNSAAPEDAPQLCTSCHGADGLSVMEGVPHLAGDPEMYLTAQLEAYRNGSRQNEIMTGLAEGLTDDEIKDAARWYSAIRMEVATP